MSLVSLISARSLARTVQTCEAGARASCLLAAFQRPKRARYPRAGLPAFRARHAMFGPGLLAITLLAEALTAEAATTRFVNASNAAPASPYTTWTGAARRIQDAVDVAVAGDLILVTNGFYATGGRVVYGAMTNRVAVNKAVTVRSVNGPEVTTICGFQNPSGPNGNVAVRCVYLAAGASLSGFTLTNGATRGAAGDWAKEQGGGGVWCESVTAVVSNCVVTGNSAYDHGAGAVGGTLNRCILTNNTAVDTVVASGGGAYGAVLNDCTLADNASLYGGGADSCTLSNCTLTNNGAAYWGGGASFSALNLCTLSANSVSAGGGGGAYWCTLTDCAVNGNWVQGGNGGGGAYYGTLYNCVVSGNHASACSGGGAASAELKNCLLTGNQAESGGGSYSCALNNCTLSGNWASLDGGGDYGSRLTNCIVYYNNSYMLSGSNWSGSTASYCCTFPLPGGAGNFTNAPVFVNLAGGNLRLLPGSPCINAGLNAAAPGPVDLDGNTRIVSGTVDLGAYEWTGRPQFVSLQRPGTNGMTLYLLGESGRVVDFYASSNLTQWFYLARRTNTTGQVVYTDSGATNQPRRLYRAVQLP